MDIRDIRRKNLRALMDHLFQPGSRGQQSRFGEILAKPQNLVSRLLMEPEKKGAKTIGEDLARDIESTLNLDRYSLDDPQLSARLAGVEVNAASSTAAVAVPRAGGVSLSDSGRKLSQLIEHLDASGGLTPERATFIESAIKLAASETSKTKDVFRTLVEKASGESNAKE